MDCDFESNELAVDAVDETVVDNDEEKRNSCEDAVWRRCVTVEIGVLVALHEAASRGSMSRWMHSAVVWALEELFGVDTTLVSDVMAEKGPRNSVPCNARVSDVRSLVNI